MKKTLLLFLLIGVFSPVLAQNYLDSLSKLKFPVHKITDAETVPNRDSLLKQIPRVSSPAKRIAIFYDILQNHGELNPKMRFYYMNKILEMARKINDPELQAVVMSELSYNLETNGAQVEAVKLGQQALKLAESVNSKQAMAYAHMNLTVSDPNNASVKIHTQKALEFARASGDDYELCLILLNMGQTYMWEHKSDSAAYCIYKSSQIALHDKNQLAICYNLFSIAELQSSPKEKLKYLTLALGVPMVKIDIRTLSLNSIAESYQQQHQIDSAIWYAKKSYQSALRGAFNFRTRPTRLLAQLYKNLNADSALKYTNIYDAAKDSVYSATNAERATALAFADRESTLREEAEKKAYQNTLKFYFLSAMILVFVALAFVFWRNNKQSRLKNFLLQQQKEKLQETLDRLKQAQTQLIQSEKMASLGELTAGIAHEIQNPLNFVNNFSEVSRELLSEMKDELAAGNMDDVADIAADLDQNLEKIHHHGKRADSIVKAMLEHSRASTGTKEPTDLNKLTDEYLRLAYHGLRAKDKNFNAELVTRFEETLPPATIIPQDIGRVLLNLFNNAFYAVQQKQKNTTKDYKPEVVVTTSKENNQVMIIVKDNGIGIPDALKDKIMQPFFTTKPTGEGTGLGLSLSYDMVV
ncbi:MAG: histidine kinase, partial [Massilia sp.]|nr:histidine kinase [Massilia sp.]